MKIFLDTADCDEIRALLLPTGMIDGVTTNPSLIAKSGRDIKQTIAEICGLVDGPVSAEVTAIELTGMREEAKILTGLAKNVTIKVPLTQDGLTLCRELADQGIMVNVTNCAFPLPKPCWRPRLVQPLFLRSSDGWMIWGLMA